MELFDRLSEHKELALGVTIGSVVMFVATLVLVPFLVARAPEDFFVREERPPRSALGWAGFVAKNLLGLVALVAGVLMLLLPGQGILTLVVGVSLVDFPGKRRLQRWLVQKDSVKRALGWLRKRAKKPDFQFP